MIFKLDLQHNIQWELHGCNFWVTMGVHRRSVVISSQRFGVWGLGVFFLDFAAYSSAFFWSFHRQDLMAKL